MKIQIDKLYEYLKYAINQLTEKEHNLDIKSYTVKIIPQTLNTYYHKIMRKEYVLTNNDNSNYFHYIIDTSTQIDTIIYQEEEHILSDIINENEITKIIFNEPKISMLWKTAIFETLKQYSIDQAKRQKNIIYLNKDYEGILDFTKDDFDEFNIKVKTLVLTEKAIEN